MKEISSPWLSLNRDWYGTKTEDPYKAKLQLDNNRICFSVAYPCSLKIGEQTGTTDYVEGLWQDSVGELFVKPLPTDDNYYEINLAPSGNYWLMRFHRYRERDNTFKGEVIPVSINTCMSGNRRICSIEVERSNIPISLDSLVNICAISKNEGKISYYSLGRQLKSDFSNSDPDFHLSNYLISLDKILSLSPQII